MKDRQIAKPTPDDVVDLVAKEVAALVGDHLEEMYPEAARAVAWGSARSSIQGVVRNSMKSAGKAAETGAFEEWLTQSRSNRAQARRARRKRQEAGERPGLPGGYP